MNRSDCFRLERPLAGQDSHLLGGTAFPRRTEKLKAGARNHLVHTREAHGSHTVRETDSTRPVGHGIGTQRVRSDVAPSVPNRVGFGHRGLRALHDAEGSRDFDWIPAQPG